MPRHSIDIGYCTRSMLKKSSTPQNNEDQSKSDVTNSPGPLTRAKRKCLENTPIKEKSNSECYKDTPNSSGIKAKSTNKIRNEITNILGCDQKYPVVQLKDINDKKKSSSRRSLNPSFFLADKQTISEEVEELDSKSCKKYLTTKDNSINTMNDSAVEAVGEKAKKNISPEKVVKSEHGKEVIKSVKFAKDVEFINVGMISEAVKTISNSNLEKMTIEKQMGKSNKAEEYSPSKDSDDSSNSFDLQLTLPDNLLKDIKMDHATGCETIKTGKKLFEERGHIHLEERTSNKENQIKPLEIKEKPPKKQSESKSPAIKDKEEISESLTNRSNYPQQVGNKVKNLLITGCPNDLKTPTNSPKLLHQNTKKKTDSPTEAAQFPQDISNDTIELEKIMNENEIEYTMRKNESKIGVIKSSEMKTQVETVKEVIKSKQDSTTEVTQNGNRTQNIESEKSAVVSTSIPINVSQSPQEKNNYDVEVKVESSSKMKNSVLDSNISTIQADYSPVSPAKIKDSSQECNMTQNIGAEKNTIVDAGSPSYVNQSPPEKNTDKERNAANSSELKSLDLSRSISTIQDDYSPESPAKINVNPQDSNITQNIEIKKNIIVDTDSLMDVSQSPQEKKNTENEIKEASTSELKNSNLDNSISSIHADYSPESPTNINDSPEDCSMTKNIEAEKNIIVDTGSPTNVSQSPQPKKNTGNEIKEASTSVLKNSDLDNSISTIQADFSQESPAKVNDNLQECNMTQNMETEENIIVNTGSPTNVSQSPQPKKNTGNEIKEASTSELKNSDLDNSISTIQADFSPKSSTKVKDNLQECNMTQNMETEKNVIIDTCSPMNVSPSPQSKKNIGNEIIAASSSEPNNSTIQADNKPEFPKKMNFSPSKTQTNVPGKYVVGSGESDSTTKICQYSQDKCENMNLFSGDDSIVNVGVLSATCENKKSEILTENFYQRSKTILNEVTVAPQKPVTPKGLMQRANITAVTEMEPPAIVFENIHFCEYKSRNCKVVENSVDENKSESPTVSNKPSPNENIGNIIHPTSIQNVGPNSSTTILAIEKLDVSNKKQLQQDIIDTEIESVCSNKITNSLVDESSKTDVKLQSPVNVIQNSEISELTQNSNDQSVIESDSPSEVHEVNCIKMKSSDKAKTVEGPATNKNEIVVDEKISNICAKLPVLRDQAIDKIISLSGKESNTVCVKRMQLEKSTAGQTESVPCLSSENEECSNNECRYEEPISVLNFDCMKKSVRLEDIHESFEEISSDEENVEVLNVSSNEIEVSDLEDNVEEEVSDENESEEEDVIDLEEEEEAEGLCGKYFLDDEAEEGEEDVYENDAIILDDEEENESNNDTVDDEAEEYEEEKNSENSNENDDNKEKSENKITSRTEVGNEESDDFRKGLIKSQRFYRIESDEASCEEELDMVSEKGPIKIEKAKLKKNSSRKKSLNYLQQKTIIKENGWIITSLDESKMKNKNKIKENRQTRSGNFVVSKMTSTEFSKQKSEPKKNISKAGNWYVGKIAETYAKNIPVNKDVNNFKDKTVCITEVADEVKKKNYKIQINKDTNLSKKNTKKNLESDNEATKLIGKQKHYGSERKNIKVSKTVKFLDNEKKRGVDCIESTVMKTKRFKAERIEESDVIEVSAQDNLQNLKNSNNDDDIPADNFIVTVGNIPSWTTSKEVKNAFLQKGFNDVDNVTDVYSDDDFKEMNFIKLTFTSMESYKGALDSYGKIILKGNPLFIFKDESQNSNECLPKKSTNNNKNIENVKSELKSDQNVMILKKDGKKNENNLIGRSIKNTKINNEESKPKFSCIIKCLENTRLNAVNVEDAFQSMGITDVKFVKSLKHNKSARIEFSSNESLAKALYYGGLINIDEDPIIIINKRGNVIKQTNLFKEKTENNLRASGRSEEETTMKTTEKNGDNNTKTYGIQKEKNFSLIIKKLPPTLTKKNLKTKLNEYGIKDVEKIIINRSNNCGKYLDGVIMFNTKKYYLKALQLKDLLIDGSKIKFKEIDLQSGCQ